MAQAAAVNSSSSVAAIESNDSLLGEHGWYAEVEARRRIRSKLPESARLDFLYPAPPDPQRARIYDPDGVHDDHCLNDELRAMDGIEVNDANIRIPHETVEQLETDVDGVDELDELVWRCLAKMRVAEHERGGSLLYDVVDDPQSGSVEDQRRTDPRPLYVEVSPDHPWCSLQQMWDSRREENRDLKGLVTARDSQTGTGKTTLAEQLCLDWVPGWNAEEMATLESDTYVDRYLDLDPGDVLLGDEMEQMADNRRSMHGNNIMLTQFWSTMRAWEVSTICTLPSTSMLDKRLKELCDFRINVIERGLGIVYKTKVDDHSGEVKEKRLHRVRWDALDDHPEHEALEDKKEEHMEDFAENSYLVDDEEIDAVEELPKELRNEIMLRLENVGVSQSKLGAVFDLGQSGVSRATTAAENAREEGS